MGTSIPGFIEAGDLKFYLYRSTAKIESLYGQIEKSPKKTKLKWKLNLHAVSNERETETSGELNDEQKLQLVLRELDEQQLVGSIEDRKPYIRGLLPMRWGIYEDDGMRPSNQGPFVYFGSDSDDVLLGMGGSSHHVESWYGVTATGSRSATPALVEFLLHGIDIGERPLRFERADRQDMEKLYEAMALANHYLRGPVQNLEFVAKVLCRDEQCRIKPWGPELGAAILATPLYVRQIDVMSVDD